MGCAFKMLYPRDAIIFTDKYGGGRLVKGSQVRKAKHGNEREFVQTVEEVFSSLSPVIDAHPEYEKADLLNRMT